MNVYKKFWIVVILTFWILFWGLNGFDKFFNGSFVPMASSDVTSSVIMSPDNDEVIYRVQPMHVKGFYGVNRDSKMEIFFSRIGLSEKAAHYSLYTIALLEIGIALLALVFLLIYIATGRITIKQLVWIHGASFVLLAIFSSGDIFFGERTELWEHVTFLIAVLISYRFLEKEISD